MKFRCRIRTFLLTCLVLLFMGIAAILLINLHVITQASKYTLSAEEAAELENADCILVLGCGVYQDRPTPLLADRLQRGVALYQSGAAPKILMSGDHGQADYDEVNIMKQYAMDANIPECDIFMDHAGFSTYESMYRARDVFEADKIIIVTQKYHLSRAVYIARALGLDAYGVASDYRSFGGQFFRDCREVLARVKDLFTTVTKPLPTYLGEVIPINGNGQLTNG